MNRAILVVSMFGVVGCPSPGGQNGDGGVQDSGAMDSGPVCLPADAGVLAAMPFPGVSADAGLPASQFAYDYAWAICD